MNFGGLKAVLTKTGGRLPQSNALLRIYCAGSDETTAAVFSDTLGKAMILLPEGIYDLRVSKIDYKTAFFKNIIITKNDVCLIEWDCIHRRADPKKGEYTIDFSGGCVYLGAEGFPLKQGQGREYPVLPISEKSCSECIRRFQEFFNNACEHLDVVPYLKTDGVYGVITKNAVKAFQSFYGLDVSGIVDSKTWEKLVN